MKVPGFTWVGSSDLNIYGGMLEMNCLEKNALVNIMTLIKKQILKLIKKFF